MATPKGKSNLEKGTEPPAQKTAPSDLRMPPSGNLEYAGKSYNTASV